MSNQQWYTVAQAAVILQISKLSVWRGVKAGDISSVRIGRKILIPDVYFEELKNKARNPQGAA